MKEAAILFIASAYTFGISFLVYFAGKEVQSGVEPKKQFYLPMSMLLAFVFPGVCLAFSLITLLAIALGALSDYR